MIDLFVYKTEWIFDCGIQKSDRQPPPSHRASHKEPQRSDNKHRKCHQHWGSLQARGNNINEENLTTGEHETSTYAATAKGELKSSFSPTSDP